MLIDKRLDDLRDGLDGQHAARWRRLREQCDWYRTQTPPTEHPSASITYFGPPEARGQDEGRPPQARNTVV